MAESIEKSIRTKQSCDRSKRKKKDKRIYRYIDTFYNLKLLEITRLTAFEFRNIYIYIYIYID